MNYDKIRDALPPDNMSGKRTALRQRSDVGKIVADLVLRRERLVDVAQRCKTTPEAVRRFKNKFITDHVTKLVHAEASLAAHQEADEEINDLQDATQKGIHKVLKEQERLYARINDIVDNDEQLLDAMSPLMQLLRDQTRTYEALAKTYSQLKDKTTVIVTLNDHPDAAKLLEVLYIVFQAYPDAFAMFKRLATDKALGIEMQ